MLSELLLRLKAARHRRRLERDLDEELAYHLQRRAESLRAAGEPDPELAAQRRFGNPGALRESLRDLWTFPRLESIGQDLRYAARLLRNSPGFTLVAVLSVALAIGANTAIFTVIDNLLLKTLPLPEPGRLIILRNGVKPSVNLRISRRGNMGSRDGATGLQTGSTFPYPALERFQQRMATASVLGFTNLGDVQAVVNGRATMGAGHLVSGNYFQVLGARPALGRLLDPSDDQPGAPRAAVLSYRFWQKEFGSDPAAIGRTLNVNTVNFTVVGIADPSFYGVSAGGFISSPDVYLPLHAQPRLVPEWVEPGESAFQQSDFFWVNLMARARTGANSAAVAAETTALWRQFVRENGFSADPVRDGFTVLTSPGAQGIDSLRTRFQRPLLMLQVVVALVLLIACANLASLLLARAEARRREIHVRLALGAARGRLFRQFLTESLLLGSLACGLGVLLAHWGTRLLAAALFTTGEELGISLRPDLRVMLFSFGISLLAILLFGLAPALRAAGSGVVPHLSRMGRTAFVSRVVIVTQVALSLVLLAGSGLFLRTLQNLYSIELGFDKQNLLLFTADPTRNGLRGQPLAAFYDNLRTRLAVLPGVQSVSASNETLLSGWYSSTTIAMDVAPGSARQAVSVHYLRVLPEFFETLGVPVRLGRGIQATDTESAPAVAVISEAAARLIAPQGTALGRTFQYGGKWAGRQVTVVGVARDTRAHNFDSPIAPTIYVPYRQGPWEPSRLQFELRTPLPVRDILPQVRQVLRELDPKLPLYSVRTQSEQVDERFVLQRVLARACTGFALVALLLACIGIYGIIAHAASRRTAEIGVRVALGARPVDVSWLVLRQAALLSAIGIAVGLALSMWAARLIEAVLYQVKATDPVSFAAAAAVLAFTVLAAGYWPARRATRLDPVSALKVD